MTESDKEFHAVFDCEPVTTAGTVLSPREVERVRRFLVPQFTQNAAGTIVNATWTLLARSDGTGQFDLAFTQIVKLRMIQGRTSIALIDDSGVIVERWDTPFWRQCGSSTLTFAQPVPANVAVQTLRPQFEIDGTAQRC